jgi:hypothetical protein
MSHADGARRPAAARKSENLQNSVFKGVKGNLVKHIDFWHGIGASDFVINTFNVYLPFELVKLC